MQSTELGGPTQATGLGATSQDSGTPAISQGCRTSALSKRPGVPAIAQGHGSQALSQDHRLAAEEQGRRRRCSFQEIQLPENAQKNPRSNLDLLLGLFFEMILNGLSSSSIMRSGSRYLRFSPFFCLSHSHVIPSGVIHWVLSFLCFCFQAPRHRLPQSPKWYAGHFYLLFSSDHDRDIVVPQHAP